MNVIIRWTQNDQDISEVVPIMVGFLSEIVDKKRIVLYIGDASGARNGNKRIGFLHNPFINLSQEVAFYYTKHRAIGPVVAKRTDKNGDRNAYI